MPNVGALGLRIGFWGFLITIVGIITMVYYSPKRYSSYQGSCISPGSPISPKSLTHANLETIIRATRRPLPLLDVQLNSGRWPGRVALRFVLISQKPESWNITIPIPLTQNIGMWGNPARIILDSCSNLMAFTAALGFGRYF